MTYYKDSDNKVYAYSEIQTPKDGLTKLTAKELESHLKPQPTNEETLAKEIAEAHAYLVSTDHKFYGDYELKDGEDLDPIRVKRSKMRAFIRDNEK